MHIMPSNCNNKPQFGKLKIDAKTVTPLLEEASPQYIARLNNIGKDLVDVKRFHVVLKDNLTPKVLAQDTKKHGHMDYFHNLKHDIEPKLPKSFSMPKAPIIFSEVYPEGRRMAEYEKFSKLDELEQAAEYSKLLDKRSEMFEERLLAAQVAERERKLQEMAAKQEHKKAVSELVNNYELIEMKPLEPEKTKKKWWQIF